MSHEHSTRTRSAVGVHVDIRRDFNEPPKAALEAAGLLE